MKTTNKRKPITINGFSLIEVLIAVSIFSFLALSAAELIRQSQHGMLKSEINFKFQNTSHEFNMLLKMDHFCMDLLGTLAITDLSSQKINDAQILKKFNSEDHQIALSFVEMINLQQICEDSTTYMAELKSTYEITMPNQRSEIRERVSPLFIAVDKNTRKITSCSTSSMGMKKIAACDGPIWVNSTITVTYVKVCTGDDRCRSVPKYEVNTPDEACSEAGYVPMTEGFRCASGEQCVGPATGEDWDKINYKFGRWRCNPINQNTIYDTFAANPFCYANGQKRDNDATDIAVAYRCE